MADEIFQFTRDVVVTAYMFVLRIGVPLIVTLFVGWWLERKLAEQDRLERGKPAVEATSEAQPQASNS